MPGGSSSSIERRKTNNSSMLQEVLSQQSAMGGSRNGRDLLLCTIPIPPAAELSVADGLKLKKIAPSTIQIRERDKHKMSKHKYIVKLETSSL